MYSGYVVLSCCHVFVCGCVVVLMRSCDVLFIIVILVVVFDVFVVVVVFMLLSCSFAMLVPLYRHVSLLFSI